ncbi:MAG: lytic murein transglycosylase B [Rhodoferax sp.]|nr:lytic murein transglycosylase B [Rhodoferax sp.]MBP9928094.1 lytic murein transglycosylase B [Rhodoferax sp.]HQX58969.1 lytic murein transglycosylase B [Burkholderiaceae bacterium]HQZ04490.1 lytic murein transglycosylase B [Burkholderiaceae bacterium]
MSVSARSFLLTCLLCLCLPHAEAASKTSKRRVATQADSGVLYAGREDAMRLADEIAERRGLDRAWVRQAIGQSRQLPQVARWVLPPANPTAKNWRVYRSRFIDPVRIQAGVAFWQANEAELARAELNYGVPAEIIVGVIGVETIFGRNTGNFRVMDALSTLALDFPQQHPRATERRAFFRAELEQLLSLAQRSGADPMAYKGSYAGAMGMPQFMPSSWVKYAIDFDADGRIDLLDSPSDVIGSVAHYFQAFGWQKGLPTHYSVHFDKTVLDLDSLLAPDILPTFSVQSFMAKGAIPDAAGQRHEGPLALVELFNGEAPATYVAGTENFYVVTRYNWSSYYALAVIELGREVAAARAR